MAVTIQSTYLSEPVRGFPGMVANGEESNRISRTIEDAAGIAFGKAAFQGAGDHGITATPAAGWFMGVAIADAGVIQPVGGTADVYPQYSSVGLLNEGEIFVTPSVNVVKRDLVYVTAGGAFTNVASGNALIPAKFDETVSAGGIVRLRVTRS